MKRTYLAALLLASIATAQTVTDQYKTTVQPQDVKADVVLEQRLYVVKTLRTDGGCVGCSTGIGTRSWDFPPLGNTGGLATCSSSGSVTVPGALIGDACNAASDLGADGGAALSSSATLSCVAGTGTATIKLCAFFTDAGSYDLTDAGFTARTFR